MALQVSLNLPIFFFIIIICSIWVPGLKQWYCLLWHWVMFLFSSSPLPLTFNFIFVYWSHTKAGIYFPLLLTWSPIVGTHWWKCRVRTPPIRTWLKRWAAECVSLTFKLFYRPCFYIFTTGSAPNTCQQTQTLDRRTALITIVLFHEGKWAALEFTVEVKKWAQKQPCYPLHQCTSAPI